MNLKMKEKIEGLAFVLPAFLFMAALIGYPLVYNLVLSLHNLDVKTFSGDGYAFIGFQNYKTLFADPIFWMSLKNTFLFTVLSLVFQFSIGFALALLFSQKFKLAGPVRGLMLVAYMMPVSVTALLFRNMFMTDGVLNDILLRLHLIQALIEWLIHKDVVMYSLIFTNCWVGIPFNMLLLLSGLSGISNDLYESAKIDGANAGQRFFHITLPLLKPAIISVLTLGFIYTFKVFDLIYMMTNGGPRNASEVLATYAYNLSFTQYKFSLGSAAANIMFLCLFLVGMFYLHLQNKEE